MGPGRALERLLLLLGVLGGAAGGPHSLRYFYVAVSEPSLGVPQYVIVGYVDGNVIIRYDSETGRAVPGADWMAANLDQAYWDRETQIGQSTQQVDRVDLETLRSRYNQSGGAHTVQTMYGCDLLEDGSTRGYYQDAYDGRDFIAFDMDTMTFTAADAAAQITKRKWEEDGAEAERWKQYLKNTCIEWLRKYVSYGRAVLERKEPPAVRVSGKEAHGILTLRCRAHGFYPRPITVSWLKDGEVRDQETEWGSVAPNSDGTYYTWASIEARPGEQDKYRCRVEHASLPEPGLYAWGEPGGLGHVEGWAGVVALPLLTALLSPRDGVQPVGHRAGGGRCRRGRCWHLWIRRMEAEVGEEEGGLRHGVKHRQWVWQHGHRGHRLSAGRGAGAWLDAAPALAGGCLQRELVPPPPPSPAVVPGLLPTSYLPILSNFERCSYQRCFCFEVVTDFFSACARFLARSINAGPPPPSGCGSSPGAALPASARGWPALSDTGLIPLLMLGKTALLEDSSV